MANACGRLSLTMVEDCSAESVVDDIMERVEEEHVVEWKLLSMIDFDRSSDWGCWNAVVVPPNRRNRRVNT